MRRLIDVAKSLEPGTRLRISDFDARDAKGKRFYTPPLTDAQIYAYQEWIVLRAWPSRRADAIKQMLCSVTAPQNAAEVIAAKKAKETAQEKPQTPEDQKNRPEDERNVRETKNPPEDQEPAEGAGNRPQDKSPAEGTKEPSQRRGRGRPRKEAVKDG